MTHIRQLTQKLFPQGQFARNVSLLAGGTALSQGFAVLAAPVLTRLYRAEDFGAFQIYMSIMAFAILAVTFRYEQAILLPDQEDTAASLVVVSLGTVAVISIGAGCVAWLLLRGHVWPKGGEQLQPYWWLFPLSICGAGIYQTLNFWALRQKAYSRVTGTKLTQVASMLGTQLVVGLVHPGPLGLLVGDAVGRVNGSLGLARLAWKRSWDVFRSVRWRTIWTAAVRYRRFPLVSTSSSMLSVAGYALPALVLAQFYGARTLGWFALSDRVLGVPCLLIGQAVSQVYSVEAAGFSNSNPEALRALFLRLARRLAVLGVLPCAALLLFAPSMFAFVFGEGWREAGVYARLLSVMQYVALIAWPLMPTLNILEKQFWQLAWDAGRLAMTLASLWLAHRWGWTASGAIAAFGIAMLAGYVAHLLLCHWAIQKRIEEFALCRSQTAPSPGLAEVGQR